MNPRAKLPGRSVEIRNRREGLKHQATPLPGITGHAPHPTGLPGNRSRLLRPNDFSSPSQKNEVACNAPFLYDSSEKANRYRTRLCTRVNQRDRQRVVHRRRRFAYGRKGPGARRSGTICGKAEGCSKLRFSYRITAEREPCNGTVVPSRCRSI